LVFKNTNEWFSANWEKSTQSDYIFKLQKRIITVIMAARIRDSCRAHKILKILPLPLPYIFSLAKFIVSNKGLFMENSELYNINIRNNSNLYHPSSHQTISQKGPYYIGIKVYNNIPAQIKMLSCNIKQFKTALMNVLQIHSFYTLSEYFNYN
jgi:hypothetical protein